MFAEFLAICVFCIYLIDSYLIGRYLFEERLTIIESLLIGFSLQSAIFILVGFMLSFFSIFSPITTSLIFWVFTVILVLISFPEIKRQIANLKSNRNIETYWILAPVFCAIFLFVLCLVYEGDSPLPQGWDRGIHFSDFLYLFSNGSMYQYYPGTDYLNFYLNGFNFLLSFIAMVICLPVGADIGLVTSDLTLLGIIFSWCWAFLIALWPVLTYAFAERITGESRIAGIASIFAISISGTEYSRLGSLGTSFGYFMVMTIFLIVILKSKDHVSSRRSSLVLFPIIAATITIHIIISVFLPFLLGMYYLISLISKRLTFRSFVQRAVEIGFSGLFGVGVLFVFSNSLFFGIFEEIFRKTSVPSGSVTTTFLERYSIYLSSQISAVLEVIPLILIPLMIAGLVSVVKEREWHLNALLLIVTIFLLLPIIEFPRAIYYLSIPMMVIASIGFVHILNVLTDFELSFNPLNKIKRTLVYIVVIGIIVFPTLSYQLELSINPGPYREYSDLDESKSHPIEMAEWIENNISSDCVLTLPTSGGFARYLDLVLEHEIYFADRRYSDLPQYLDVALMYNDDVDWIIRYSLLLQYNVSVLIEGLTFRIENETAFNMTFPDMVVYSLFDGLYKIRILYSDVLISSSLTTTNNCHMQEQR